MRVVALLIIIGAIFLGILSTLIQARWSGGFFQAHYRIVLRDDKGRPIQGATLQVVDPQGRTAYYYPVTDFIPGAVLQSDADGVLEFHHVGLSGVEFGGSCARVFSAFPIGDCSGPDFFCRIRYQGETICTIPYRELNARITKKPPVGTMERNWSVRELVPDLETADFSKQLWTPPQMQNGDFDGNGKMQIEERALNLAYYDISDMVNRAFRSGELLDPDAGELLEFWLVEKHVTVPIPGPH